VTICSFDVSTGKDNHLVLFCHLASPISMTLAFLASLLYICIYYLKCHLIFEESFKSFASVQIQQLFLLLLNLLTCINYAYQWV
jgi:hypothetical protein